MKSDTVGGPIRWRMHIPAVPDVVFSAVDTAAGRASFWAESAEERAGWIEFRFANGDRYRSAILERIPPRLLAIEYFGGHVRIELNAVDATATDLLLTHTGVQADDWHEVHAGWLNVLFPLKAWVVHGVDLRNHDPTRTWEEGYADQ